MSFLIEAVKALILLSSCLLGIRLSRMTSKRHLPVVIRKPTLGLIGLILGLILLHRSQHSRLIEEVNQPALLHRVRHPALSGTPSQYGRPSRTTSRFQLQCRQKLPPLHPPGRLWTRALGTMAESSKSCMEELAAWTLSVQRRADAGAGRCLAGTWVLEALGYFGVAAQCAGTPQPSTGTAATSEYRSACKHEAQSFAKTAATSAWGCYDGGTVTMRVADLEFKLGLDFVDQCDFFERFRILWKRCRCLGAPSMMKYSPGKWLWLGAPELVDLMMAEDLVCHAQLIVVASQADFEFVPSSDNGRDKGRSSLVEGFTEVADRIRRCGDFHVSAVWLREFGEDRICSGMVERVTNDVECSANILEQVHKAREEQGHLSANVFQRLQLLQ